MVLKLVIENFDIAINFLKVLFHIVINFITVMDKKIT